MKTDLTLVTDLPTFHNYRIPDNFRITGPIFAGNDDAAYGGKTAELDADIAAHMRDGNRPAILVTMGSSGTSELLFEAIKALMPTLDAREKVPQDDWNVVILASPAICRLDEAQAVARNHPRLLVTDRFIPGPAANAMADLVVTHGGQGTVQTAIAAGTPIVGVGVQMEQQINLDHVMDAGAGIRIQRHNWRALVIRKAVTQILLNSRYKNRAAVLAETIRKIDRPRNAGDRMWEFLLDL